MNNGISEKQNWIYSLARKPECMLTLLVSLYDRRNKFFRKFLKIFLGKPERTVPPYLKRIKGMVKLTTSNVVNKIDCYKESNIERYVFNSDSSRIKLASEEQCSPDGIDWEKSFRDKEDYLSLHRWNWLIFKLSETKEYSVLKEWARHHIHDWIIRYSAKIDNTLKWEPYTTGERISNSIIFMETISLEPDTLIKEALSRMAYQVSNNIEYYGPKDTFNHIINNARALYLYGVYFNQLQYLKMAKEIIKNELPKLITIDGFLREGSSHYHFLFTRWLLEIIYMAQKNNDSDFVSNISPYIEKLTKRCCFFLVFDKNNSRNHIPLFGDVSPDCTPDWLISLPQSSLSRFSYNYEKYPQNKDRISQVFIESGWLRFDFRNTTLFLHIEPEGVPLYPNHSHRDMCSFCLYRQGEEVLVDSGRRNYIKDSEGRYGVSSRSHNSVQIDGLDPYPGREYSGVWKFICRKPNVSWLETEDVIEIKIKHFGFNRIYNDKINHERTIKLSSSQIIIEDYFEGNKSHLAESFFHWAKGLEIFQTGTSEEFVIFRGEEKYIIKCELPAQSHINWYSGNSEMPAGWYFPEYGLRIPIWTMVSKTNTKFPFRQRFIIRWN